MKDPRMSQVKKILVALEGKNASNTTDVLVIGNTLVIVDNNTVMYLVDLKETMENLNPVIGFKYPEIIDLPEEDDYINNQEVINRIYPLYTQYNSIINSTPVLNIDNVRADPLFEELISMKADEGMKFYKVNDLNGNVYAIPIFTGCPSLSKQDTADLAIYDFDYNKALVSYIINKKKINRVMRMNFVILKII